MTKKWKKTENCSTNEFEENATKVDPDAAAATAAAWAINQSLVALQKAEEEEKAKAYSKNQRNGYV